MLNAPCNDDMFKGKTNIFYNKITLCSNFIDVIDLIGDHLSNHLPNVRTSLFFFLKSSRSCRHRIESVCCQNVIYNSVFQTFLQNLILFF